MKTKEIRKEDIEILFEEYNIEIKGENFIDSLCNKINGYVSDILIEGYKDIMLETAKLLYYFRGIGDEIEIKGIIEKPRFGERKNQERKSKLNISTIKDDLEANLSKTIRAQDPILSFTATMKAQHINVSEKIEEGYFESDEFVKRPLSDEELEYIIERGSKDKEQERKITKNMYLGNLCILIKNNILANCAFDDEKFVLDSIKGYSLLYDIIALSGFADKIVGEKQYKGLIGKEKHIWVNNKITAWENHKKKKYHIAKTK